MYFEVCWKKNWRLLEILPWASQGSHSDHTPNQIVTCGGVVGARTFIFIGISWNGGNRLLEIFSISHYAYRCRDPIEMSG